MPLSTTVPGSVFPFLSACFSSVANALVQVQQQPMSDEYNELTLHGDVCFVSSVQKDISCNFMKTYPQTIIDRSGL